MILFYIKLWFNDSEAVDYLPKIKSKADSAILAAKTAENDRCRYRNHNGRSSSTYRKRKLIFSKDSWVWCPRDFSEYLQFTVNQTSKVWLSVETN